VAGKAEFSLLLNFRRTCHLSWLCPMESWRQHRPHQRGRDVRSACRRHCLSGRAARSSAPEGLDRSAAEGV